ncbi:MAG: hypothetical protein ACTSQI_01915 [Candidatus Helarchaeota archaeon]
MVNEISVIGWRDDIGAYLIMQYPRKMELLPQDIMQIYTAHRQSTLYPNFATIKYRGKKIASYFSGMKNTEFVGAPNFIISIYLEEAEVPSNFREFLPRLAKHILSELFEKLREILNKIEEIKGIIILTREEDIGDFPVLVYPEMRVSSKLISDIYNAHFSASRIEKACSSEFNGQKFASYFTGFDKEKYLVMPNFIVTYLLNENTSPDNFKKKIYEKTHYLLSEISKLIANGLERCQEQAVELMIEIELKESPIFRETDFKKIADLSDEPEVIMGYTDQFQDFKGQNQTNKKRETRGSVDQLLDKIKSDIQEELGGEDGSSELSNSPKTVANQIELLKKQLCQKKEQIQSLYEEIHKLRQSIEEKDQKLKKLMMIIKSIRKYVSY